MDYSTFAREECDMDEENIGAKIKDARAQTQKNKRLQAIHKAHLEVLLKAKAIEDAEGKLWGKGEAQRVSAVGVHTPVN